MAEMFIHFRFKGAYQRGTDNALSAKDGKQVSTNKGRDH